MDAGAFNEYYAAAFPGLVRQVYALCGNHAEATDCVQEAFVRAWSRLATFDRDDPPDAWIRTVAYRLAVSRWRRHRRDTPLLDHDRSVNGPGPDHVALTHALQQLPENHRRAIVLHYLADQPVDDVAREMGANPGTVKVWLQRGRGKLATLLDEKEIAHA